MSSCGTVSMDRYWSYVATPLFFTTIAAGVFTLFTIDDIHIVDRRDISKTVSLIRKAATGPDAGPAAVAAPAAPATPATPATPAAPPASATRGSATERAKGALKAFAALSGKKASDVPKAPGGPQPRAGTPASSTGRSASPTGTPAKPKKTPLAFGSASPRP